LNYTYKEYEVLMMTALSFAVVVYSVII